MLGTLDYVGCLKVTWDAATKAEREAFVLECKEILDKSSDPDDVIYRLIAYINAIKARGAA